MDSMGYMKARKTFEINPSHPIIRDLLEKVKQFEVDAEARLDAAEEADDDEEAKKTLSEDSAEEKMAKDNAVLLFQTCLIQSGFTLPTDSAKDFSNRLERLVRTGLNVAVDAKIEEPEVEIPEDPVVEDEDDEEADDLDLDEKAEEVVDLEIDPDSQPGHNEL